MSWINNNLQSNGAGLWQSGTLPFEPGENNGAMWSGQPSPYGDGFRGNWWGSSQNQAGFAPSASGPASNANGLLGQIMSLVQQYIGNLTNALGAGSFGGGNGQPYDQPGATTFSNATLSSTGDPHLALNGTQQNADGSTAAVNAHFDNMQGHDDLFSSNDFGDRFRVSTTTTQPNASGVTYNATATATMNGGRDSVTMGPGGSIGVTSDGSAISLTAGQTVTLAGGETVSENANGSVSIAERNARGESLSTTFSNNGAGVDVNATAAGGVALAGYLVRQAAAHNG